MIPKTIHYFWEGPPPSYSYVGSWIKYCPDYTLRQWSASSIPLNEQPRLQVFVDQKKWSVLSDFMRSWAIYNEGGFYLDADVELIKPLDPLREIKAFTCIEGPPASGNNAVCGGEAGHPYQALSLELFMAFDFDKLLRRELEGNQPPEIVVGPNLVTRIITKYKGSQLDTADMLQVNVYGDGFTTLPKSYFYPYNFCERYTPKCVQENTIGIHHWKSSWGGAESPVTGRMAFIRRLRRAIRGWRNKSA